MLNVRNTLDRIAFDCENQPAMCEKLTRLGIEFELDQVPGCPISQVFFCDPAGNGVELSFNG